MNLTQLRFIPTAVGNADWRRLLGPRPAVHPHGCGERIASCMANSAKCGSSPRLWGTLLFQALVMRLERFIPTAVGNALPSKPGKGSVTVHPHGCGERRWVAYFDTSSTGSSPRLWGTLSAPWPAAISARFIPTAVGNALIAVSSEILAAVHPHGCGERVLCSIFGNRITGSSPRLWGTRGSAVHSLG